MFPQVWQACPSISPLSSTRNQRPALVGVPAGAEPPWLSPGHNIFQHVGQTGWWLVGCRVIAECFCSLGAPG